MYFKDCSIVKSHNLDEVLRKNCAVIDFMEDMMGSDGDIPHVEFPSFLKRADGLLNSESLDIQLSRRTFMIIQQ